jgi:hypothetical protein
MLLASLILTADLSLSLIHSTAHLFTYPSACISTCDFNVRFKLLWVCWKQAMQGSYAAFIALHRAMLQQNKFAVAFYGSRASSQLVALVPQEEELADGLQLEPPGMHMIYLPYADDIRPTEKYHISSEASVPRASKEQVEAAAAFINKMKLDSWSVFDISDPGDL